jgi:predicted RNA methylase
MLTDAVRLRAYNRAIQRYVTSQDCVVDIGTGTGVLAFFAAARIPAKSTRWITGEDAGLCQSHG